MRILNIVRSMNPETGGPSKDIRDSSIFLDKLEIKNEVISFDDNKFVCDKDSYFIHHPLGIIRNKYGYTRKIFSWLKKNNNRFDVAILHGLWQLYEIEIYRFLKNENNKLIFLIKPHGMLDPWFQNDPSRKFKAFRNKLYWQLFEKKIINYSSGLLFGSNIEKNLAATTFKGFNPINNYVVGNFVTQPPLKNIQLAEAFYSRVPYLKKEEKFALFLSRINFKKGLENLIYAWKDCLMSKKLPKLLIAGPKENDYAKKLINLVKKMGLSDKIFFCGMLEDKAKWGAFYFANIFILPSHQENYGIAVVEALACGCPVFITNKVNIYPYIESGNCGVVFKDDILSLKKEILKWDFRNMDKRNIFSKNAIKTYNQKFNPEKTAYNYLNILRNILN